MGAWYDNHMDTKYPIPKGSSFGGGNSKCDEKNVLAFFNKFKDEVAPAPKGFPQKDAVIEDKLQEFFEAIGVSDLADSITLLISYRMGAKSQGKYTYKEFKQGCESLNLDTQEKWYKAIPQLQKNWSKDADLFEAVYNFTFIFSQEEGYKNIDKETACALWPILLKD